MQAPPFASRGLPPRAPVATRTLTRPPSQEETAAVTAEPWEERLEQAILVVGTAISIAAAHGSRSVQLSVRRNAVEVEPTLNQDPGTAVQEIAQMIKEAQTNEAQTFERSSNHDGKLVGPKTPTPPLPSPFRVCQGLIFTFCHYPWREASL